MTCLRRVWLVLMCLALSALAAHAEEALVPEGESADILQGTTWAPMSGLRAVAASRDGSSFASVAGDGTLRLWEAATGRELRRFPSAGTEQTAVAFSGDGKILAAGARDGSIQLFHLTVVQDQSHLNGTGSPIVSLALSQDGQTVVFVPARKPAQVWHVAEKGAPAALGENAGEARTVEASRDGKTFALGLANRSVQLVDAESLKVLRTLTGFGAAPSALAFSMDGRTLAVATDSGAVQLASFPDGRILRTIDAHAQPVTGVRFVVDGVLATTSLDGTIRLWNPTTGQELRRLPVEEGCCSSLAALNGGSTLVATSPRRLFRDDAVSGAALPDLAGPASPVVAVALDAEGKALLTAAEDGTLRLFDVGAAQPRQSWSVSGPVFAAVVSSEARTVMAGVDRSIVVWEADSGKEVRRLEGHDGPVLALALSADGSRLASGSTDRTARVWEAKTGKLLTQFPAAGPVVGVALSTDGQQLALVSEGSVRLFAVEHGTESRRLTVDGARVVSFSRDGKRLAVGTEAGTVHVFDAASGADVAKISLGKDEPVTGVALTADGKQLLTASKDKTLRLWNVEGGGSEVAKLDGLDFGATCLSLSGNDLLAAVGTGDGATHVWRVSDRSEVVLFRQAAAGWLSKRKDKVLRSEAGALVVHADPTTGLLTPVVPKGAAGNKAELGADVTGTAPAAEGGRAGRITLRITNNSATVRAYWVRLVAGDGLPAGLSIIPSGVIDRLDPGASADLTVGVAWVSRQGSPAPHEEKIPLKLTQLGGDTTLPPVSLHIGSAKVDVEVTAIEGERSAPFIRVQLSNSGEEATGPLTLVPVFVKDGQLVWTAPTVQLKDLGPKEKTLLGIATTPEVTRSKASLQLTATGTAWPTDQWSITVPLSRPLPWLAILGALAGVFLLIIGGYLFRVLRHPVVIQVTRNPAEIARYNLTRLPEVNKALTRAGRLKAALTAAKLSDIRWKRAVGAGTSPEQAAHAFAETIGGKLHDQPVAAGHQAWLLELPTLELRFPRRTAVVICTGAQLESGTAASLASALHAGGEGPTAALALDLTAEQNARAVLQSVPRMSFVVLSADEARDVLFAAEPIVAVQKLISAQRPLAELSPYQTSSGVEEDGLFFGRDRELRAIADRVLHNFIIVAPRQMGKSSLLKAVFRRLSVRTDVEVHHITLFEDDLATRVGRALNRPRPETADQFVDLAGGSRRKPRVWLIDEADSFIVKDARNKYPFAQAMRTLSEEGRGYFILAGFWHLYAAAFLNPNNPLRNFGELLRLEPLDREAARQLATRPMEALGVQYEDLYMVERLLDQTACRAHLIVAACKGMIEQLGPDDRVLTEKHLDAGLFRNPAVADEFKYWRREPLGRALLRAALLGNPPTRGELRDRLAKYGLDAPTELFAATLDRHELGFLLVSNAEGKLVCPVPLLRRFIEQEDSLEHGLQRDIRDFLAVQGGEGRAAAANG